MKTAAGIIIGDEILTGKIRDANAPVLIDMLRDCGIALRRLITISDDLDEITRIVAEYAGQYDYIFTSGGIGPTHDDRTIEGIAAALSVAVERHPKLEEILRHHLGRRVNDAALRMANVPAGATLLDEGPFPTLVFRNIYILPGVPEIFAAKMDFLRTVLGNNPKVVLHRLYLRAYESDIAEALSAIEKQYSPVKIGSYPKLVPTDYNVMVTIEAIDAALVKAAVSALRSLLPSESILRSDPEI